MPENIGLDEILRLNPQVDETLLEQAIELLHKMRQGGVSRRGYNLASPYSRRTIPISKENSVDPRTVRVGRSSSR